MLEGTLNADKFYVIFEHESPKFQDEISQDYFFWRYSCGYVQIWLFTGIVFDILKRDECRFMYE